MVNFQNSPPSSPTPPDFTGSVTPSAAGTPIHTPQAMKTDSAAQKVLKGVQQKQNTTPGDAVTKLQEIGAAAVTVQKYEAQLLKIQAAIKTNDFAQLQKLNQELIGLAAHVLEVGKKHFSTAEFQKVHDALCNEVLTSETEEARLTPPPSPKTPSTPSASAAAPATIARTSPIEQREEETALKEVEKYCSEILDSKKVSPHTSSRIDSALLAIHSYDGQEKARALIAPVNAKLAELKMPLVNANLYLR